MNQPSVVSWNSIVRLFDLKGIYLVSYAWLFGMSVWVTFFGGVIAFRALPRHQFGALQHKTFPVYFITSTLISSGLLALWTSGHPTVLDHYTDLRIADVAQAYTLAATVLSQGVNYFVVGPLTSRIMFQRHKQEKAEGKLFNENGISDQMKALNRTFGQLHGLSSLLNLSSVIALLFHGLWIGHHGLGSL